MVTTGRNVYNFRVCKAKRRNKESIPNRGLEIGQESSEKADLLSVVRTRNRFQSLLLLSQVRLY
jgi:hypothetical protein